MLRVDKEMKDPSEVERVLRSGRYATIGLCDGSEPYVITLSYGYDGAGRTLFFHTAKEGRKLDIIARNPRACATVISDRGYVQGKCDHAYSSVVLHGRMSRVEDLDGKLKALGTMIDHLDDDPARAKERLLAKRERVEGSTVVLRFDIEDVHGRSSS